MKKRSFNMIALASLLGITLCAGMVQAEEPNLSADLGVSVLSKYVWRGYEFSDDSLVVQPSLTVGANGFAMNLWGNLDLDETASFAGADAGSSSWNETDLTLSYDSSCDFADYGVGLIYYAVDAAQDTQEIYLSATLKSVLSPSLTIYRDYDAAPGWYLSLGISHSLEISDGMALDLGAKVGYMDAGDYDALHDGVISASMSFPMGKIFTITPELYYSFALSSDAEDTIKAASFSGDDDSFIYGGITVSMSL